MRTYFIVEHHDVDGPYWYAHKRGFFSLFGLYNGFNQVNRTYTIKGPEICIENLMWNKKKAKVVRVVKK